MMSHPLQLISIPMAPLSRLPYPRSFATLAQPVNLPRKATTQSRMV
jgi:hypothetical protein